MSETVRPHQTPLPRPKVSAFLGLSLDGYIAGQKGDLSWMSPFQTDSSEDTGYKALMDSVDVLIMGRNTYDVVRNFESWPYTGKRVIVLTHRPLLPLHGETTHEGPLSDLLAQLHAESYQHVYIDGGSIIREGLANGVIDTLTLSWLPVVLGNGIPLFQPGTPMSYWHPKKLRAFPSGLLQGQYTLHNHTS